MDRIKTPRNFQFFQQPAVFLASYPFITLLLIDDSYNNSYTGNTSTACDGKISDDEMRDFAFISKKLDEISLAIDSLNLWVDKTDGEQDLNLELLNAEKEKLK